MGIRGADPHSVEKPITAFDSTASRLHQQIHTTDYQRYFHIPSHRFTTFTCKIPFPSVVGWIRSWEAQDRQSPLLITAWLYVDPCSSNPRCSRVDCLCFLHSLQLAQKLLGTNCLDTLPCRLPSCLTSGDVQGVLWKPCGKREMWWTGQNHGDPASC